MQNLRNYAKVLLSEDASGRQTTRSAFSRFEDPDRQYQSGLRGRAATFTSAARRRQPAFDEEEEDEYDFLPSRSTMTGGTQRPFGGMRSARFSSQQKQQRAFDEEESEEDPTSLYRGNTAKLFKSGGGASARWAADRPQAAKSDWMAMELDERNNVLKDLVADQQRDVAKIKLLNDLFNFRRENRPSLDLCTTLASGKQVQTPDICKTLEEDAALDFAIFDMIEAMLDSKRRVDKIIKYLASGRPYLSTTSDFLREDEFDNRFEFLVNTIMEPDAGQKLMSAGALDGLHDQHSSKGKGKSSAPPTTGEGGGGNTSTQSGGTNVKK